MTDEQRGESRHLGRPEHCEDRHLEYLDGLRKSAVTNMFGAAPYLQGEFGMPLMQARETLHYWMYSKKETR